LKKAIKDGYIKITINYPINSVTEIETRLKECFNIAHVFVTPAIVDNLDARLQDTCIALANDLNGMVKDGDIIGVSWGRTMDLLADHLISSNSRGVKIVQLNGSVPRQSISTGSYKIVSSLSKSYNGQGFIFPVPAVVDNKKIADALKEDSQVKELLNLALKSKTMIFSIGNLSKKSILFEAGYINEDEYNNLEIKGAVGDICSRYFDIEGNIADKSMNERVIGISLDELKQKDNKIAIAIGEEKVDAIIGALNGKYVDRLYIDEITAKSVLKKQYENI
jgi:deoxyribonucleoside regulator